MDFPATMKIEDLDLKHEEFELLEGDFRLIELMTSGGAELKRNLDAVLHERPMEPKKLKEHRNALFNYNNIIGTVIGWYIAKLIQFGYDGGFVCSRNKGNTCYAESSTLSEVTPFVFDHETLTGVSCTTSCSVVVPAIANRVLYYRKVVRNVSGVVLTTGPTEVMFVN